MARVGSLGEVVIDVTAADVDAVVAFWAALLDVDEHARDAVWIELEPDGPGRPRLGFQVVPEAKRVKNRVHLDVIVADLDRASREARALGGRAVGGAVAEADCRFQVLVDPGGNELCLVEPR